MRFSIRSALAATFFVALLMFANSQHRASRDATLKWQMMYIELDGLRNSFLVESPKAHKLLRKQEDAAVERESLDRNMLSHFDSLREKYGTLKRVNADTLSIIAVPSIHPSASYRASYNLIVPETRNVWLKFGVCNIKDASKIWKTTDGDDEFLRALKSESEYSFSGPYELQLPSGPQSLQVTSGSLIEGRDVVRIEMPNKRIDFETSADLGDKYSDPAWYSFTRQMNVPPKTQRFPLRWANEHSTAEHAICVWLDMHSSGFEEFPSR